MGLRRRVFRRSERVEGLMVAMGWEGYVVGGMTRREVSVKWCGFVPGMGACGFRR